MTCQKCEEWQADGLVAYFRVDVANVGITGCDKHVTAVIDTLNNHLEELTERAQE